MHRIGWSLLALPIVVIALAMAYSALSAPPGGATEAILNLRYQALWYALVTYIAIGTLAAPLLLLAWRMRWLTLWHSVLAGAIVGAVAFLPMLAPMRISGHRGRRFRLIADGISV